MTDTLRPLLVFIAPLLIALLLGVALKKVLFLFVFMGAGVIFWILFASSIVSLFWLVGNY